MSFNISAGTAIVIATIAFFIAYVLFFFTGDPSIHTLIRQGLMPYDAPAKSAPATLDKF